MVIEGNPPKFFDLVCNVFTVEKMNHPVAALVAAFQQEELTHCWSFNSTMSNEGVVALKYRKRMANVIGGIL